MCEGLLRSLEFATMSQSLRRRYGQLFQHHMDVRT